MKFNLLKIRKERGLSQLQLAEKSGVSIATIKKIENDRAAEGMRSSTIVKLAIALNTPVDSLISGYYKVEIKKVPYKH